ncbi:MAG: preprotein translocase subunit SecG [Candidatus Gastranaerophilales bacterium]|nr:preprotein translocase subunit SecG [Candidatus Gastranaerophilales bacterium]
MLTTVWIIQIFSAILLTILVLMHSPKGDGLGAIGGMANLFSSQKSAESGLNKLTMYVAIIFLVTSFITGFHLFR